MNRAVFSSTKDKANEDAFGVLFAYCGLKEIDLCGLM